ncbi:uncharacterized protein LOC133805837 [Humulus lupulus]|uniref:uncharacterized protein LOC133805837 n=1 Tax=Humulus lupulus TaxID=3486 RepID=UPI002B410D42|nr:uncharacterized protein LOC133805837 [Humulus lupulus]
MSKEGNYTAATSDIEDDEIILNLEKYPHPGIRKSVYVIDDRQLFACECQYFFSFDIPCQHIFTAIKHLRITKIPKSLILTQWTIEATQLPNVQNDSYAIYEDRDAEERARFGDITSKMTELTYLGSRTHYAYEKTTYEIDKICAELRNNLQIREDSCKDKLPLHHHSDFNILDPYLSKNKGIAKMRGSKGGVARRCSICKKRGHNKSTCLQRKKKGHKKWGSDNSEPKEEDEDLYGTEDMDEWEMNTMDYSESEDLNAPTVTSQIC